MLINVKNNRCCKIQKKINLIINIFSSINKLNNSANEW